MKKITFIASLLVAAVLVSMTACAQPGKHAASTSPASIAASSAAFSATVASSAVSQSPQPAASSAASSAPVASTASTPASPATSQAPANTMAPAPQTDTVTVAISAQTAGGPSWSYSVELKSGDSVFSVMQRLADAGTIKLAYQKSPSVYIKAINGYACGTNGAMSGWLYSVNNGSPPNYGCDKYTTLKSGDTIKWRYTTTGY